jgi:uncharacterized protein
MSEEARNLATVQAVYAAFGRGDIPAILEQVTDDVDWGPALDPAVDASSVPFLAQLRGRQQVPRFFQGIQAMDYESFEPRRLFASGNEVAVRVVQKLRVKSTGKRMVLEDMHHFTFDEAGRISRWRTFLDTAGVLQAFRPE